MKRMLAVIAAVGVLLSVRAEDYSRYYTGLPVNVKPAETISFPDRSAAITAHGAVGDAVTLCTDAIQQCIDSLAALGGGHVVVPRGVWLTGPLELRSNIDLHLEANAVLYFSPDKALYVDSDPKANRVKPCITALRCSNIGVTGKGTIDGNGAQWRPVKRGKVSDVEWKDFSDMGGVERNDGAMWYPWQLKTGYPDAASTPEKQEKRRNDLFRVFYCENIFLEGVTFQNAPKFHVHPFNSRNIIMDGITVRCPWNAQNGDAIDLSDCHRALLMNCVVDCGDDGLCLKSGVRKDNTDINGVEDVLIQDCTVYHAHGGFVIGSEDICGIRRVLARDCTFLGTDTGLRFKSSVGRGGLTEDIYLNDIMMADIRGEAVVFECTYSAIAANASENDLKRAAAGLNVPEFQGIHINGIVCRGCKTAVSAHGLEGKNCVHDIDIVNSTFVYRRNATDIDPATAQIKLVGVRFVEEKK